MSKQPSLWIIAGPNGAGKSTIVARNGSLFSGTFVNPDNIAVEIDPINRNDPKVVVEAGRIALEQRKELMEKGKPFGIETTLSGHSTNKLIKEAKEKGYKVNIVYVGLNDIKISQKRVQTRVLAGGHDVPIDAIERRYPQTMDNLEKIAPLANRLYIFDNSQMKHHLLLNMNQEKIEYLKEDLPTWANGLVPNIIKHRQRENLL